MTLHLIKLCVGCDSVDDLVGWIEQRVAQKTSGGRHAHVTRMVPRRVDELLGGGSLYWVIKGQIQCRQKILAIEPFADREGVARCRLVLDPRVVPTEWQSRRPFQGWRYLVAKDAPLDLKASRRGDDLPPALRAELAALGLR